MGALAGVNIHREMRSKKRLSSTGKLRETCKLQMVAEEPVKYGK